MAIWIDIDQLNVYIDESGTVSLDDPNTWYIATAVIVPKQHIAEISNQLDSIAQTYFSGSTIKSSNVSNNHSRRERILKDICKLDFQYLFLFVDKTKLDPKSGYRFKKSCYKNLNRRLYQKLYQCGGNIISLICKVDQHGTKEFQDEAKSYFENKMAENLFQNFNMNYADDKSDRLLQLADFIAGSLSFCWVPAKKDSQYTPIFRKLLKPHELAYETFPRNKRELTPLPDNPTMDEINNELEKVLYNRALQFIEQHKDDDDGYSQRQVAMLNLFLENYEYDGSQDHHFYLEEIQKSLFEEGFEEIPRQQFISKVIGHLRNEGIIISGSNKGYCLALSLNDIKDYLDHNATVIFPMLNRIKKARSSVKATMNYDILEIVPSYSDFEAILAAIQSSDLGVEAIIDEESITHSSP